MTADLEKLKIAQGRLTAALRAGFPPLVVIHLMAECTLAMAEVQIKAADEVSGIARQVSERLGRIADEMEKMNK